MNAQEIITYLEERKAVLERKMFEYECSYDIMPDWVKRQKDFIHFERCQLSEMIEFLEGVKL